MIVIKNDKIVFFDVDDTLVLWDTSDSEDRIQFNCYEFYEALIPHKNNIKMLKAMKQEGYSIVVWSQGGYKWAEEVVNKLELSEFVDLIISKPEAIVDDLAPSFWMPSRTFALDYFKLKE